MTKSEIINFLKENRDLLRDKYGVISIGLFGSFTKDVATSESDIDIAVEIISEKKNINNFFALKRFLEKNLGRKVDLGIESAIKPIVKEEIKHNLIYVE